MGQGVERWGAFGSFLAEMGSHWKVSTRRVAVLGVSLTGSLGYSGEARAEAGRPFNRLLAV